MCTLNANDASTSRREDDEQRRLALPEPDEHGGPQQIELLFYSQGPQMQQRFELRGGIEVAAFTPEREVRHESRRGSRMRCPAA